MEVESINTNTMEKQQPRAAELHVKPADAVKVPKADEQRIEKKEDKSADEKLTLNLMNLTADRANKLLKGSMHRIAISIHEKTNRPMIKVIDTETKEIIREIPDEKSLEAYAKMLELSGLMFDEKG